MDGVLFWDVGLGMWVWGMAGVSQLLCAHSALLQLASWPKLHCRIGNCLAAGMIAMETAAADVQTFP